MKPILSFFLVCLIGIPTAQAQSFLANEAITTVYNEADTVGLSEEELQYVQVTYRLSADLQDQSVASITIWMGMEAGGKELLEKDFSLTSTQSFADGTAVTVDGNSFDIDMGQFTGLTGFEVRIMGLNSMGGVLHQLDLSYPEN